MHYTVIAWTCLNIPNLNCGQRSLFLLAMLFSVFFIASMALSRASGGSFIIAFRTAVYIWLGALFLWFSFIVCVMFAQLILTALKIKINFGLGLPVCALAVIISILSVLNAARVPSLKIINLKSDKIDRPLTIAQITDTHLGEGISAGRLQKMFDKIAGQNADIIVFTGDIFERNGGDVRGDIEIIKNAKPPCGKYAVMGNHEYYGGFERNLELWREAGITPLLNSSVETCGINLVGVNDIKTTRMSENDFAKIIKKSDTSKWTLLLSHTPLYYEEAAGAGVDLMLSGHTHNGQLWPFNLLVRTQFKHMYGAYKAAGGNFVHYVSAGAFYWGPPMRFLTYNEVPVFTIEP
jgi:predicted MPP superfamily phosphohydrolase